MTNLKDKGVETSKTKDTEQSFNKDFALNSKEVTITFKGEQLKVEVKDLEMMDVLVLFSKYADIISQLTRYMVVEGQDPTLEDMAYLMSTVENPRQKLAFFFALCCGMEDAPYIFERLSDKDLTNLLLAVQEVVDFERIKQSFLESPLLKKIQKS